MRPLETSDPRRVGPYRMLAELGSGGMGRVLLGDTPGGRLVALKRVRAQFVEDDGFRARFRREVAASRKVSGDHTAAVIDDGADEPVPWLASEFVPGPSLHAAVEAVGGLPEEAVLRLAADLASALIDIHGAGLVHRDLKPSNVLLAEGHAKVIDFGIARATDSDDGTWVTHTGWLVGAPGYMSPEQAEPNGHPLTPASDVFSLGAALVMACTGEGPFNGTSAPQMMYNVVHTEPDLSGIPEELRRIIQPCLAKEPTERPTPEQLLQQIKELLTQDERPEQPWPREIHQMITAQRDDVLRFRMAADERQVSPDDEQPTVVVPPHPQGGAAWARRVFAWVRDFTREASRTVRGVPPGGSPTGAARGRTSTSEPDGPGSTAQAAGWTPPRPAPPLRARLMAAVSGPKARRALRRSLDVAFIVLGVLGGVIAATKANSGALIPMSQQHFHGDLLDMEAPGIPDGLIHPSYVGAVAGAWLGGLSGVVACIVAGLRSALTSFLVLVALSVTGFVVGWIGDDGGLDVAVISVGEFGDEGGWVGALLGLAPLVVASAVSQRGNVASSGEQGCGIVAALVVTTAFTACLGAVCGYYGWTGLVLGDSSRIGLFTAIGAAVGGSVAFRIVAAARGRRGSGS
ncbi:serine/threonine-protein kinase [Streptomyces sp. CA-250714]|uniref:serine/threonine-protein kinase n=1 Tax=Streptomyces sp. CA-250714 TaxID=3240060 RepID=UPI003D8FF4DF